MENYIFISYAHKDSGVVLPIVRAMQENGIPVWFDEGIEAGTEWPATIEQKLIDCAAVIVFISPASVQSQNCRNEVNLALSLKKEMMTAYLEETTLAAGMNLQLGTIQAIYRHRHPNDTSFCNTLIGSEFVSQFRPDAPVATGERQPAPVPTPVRVADPITEIAKAKRYGKVTFGRYPQETMSPEPIRWVVLQKNCGEALLISEKILDCRYFGKVLDWERSEMRQWLNGEFAAAAFNAAELAQIDELELYTDTVAGVQKTVDRVFLLDNAEAVKLSKKFFRKRILAGIVTPYAKRKGAYLEKNRGIFWLRSSHVDRHGYSFGGNPCHHNVSNMTSMCTDPTQNSATVLNGMGVRPVIWVKYI